MPENIFERILFSIGFVCAKTGTAISRTGRFFQDWKIPPEEGMQLSGISINKAKPPGALDEALEREIEKIEKELAQA